VIAQRPSAGKRLTVGSNVNLVISGGPPRASGRR
jgi:beta-lactam-binding protein with PASTA domain